MDVVSIPKLKLNYRTVPTYKGLKLIEIKSTEAKKKICKIVNKRSVKKKVIKGKKEGSKIQLNFHDGHNVLVDAKEAKKYEVGDSLLVELPTQKILDHIELEKDALVIVTKGRNIGLTGKIEKIIVTKTKEPTKLICKIGGEKLEVIKDYVFVMGKENQVIKLTEE